MDKLKLRLQSIVFVVMTLILLPHEAKAVRPCQDIGLGLIGGIQYPQTENGRTVSKTDWQALPEEFSRNDLPYYTNFSVLSPSFSELNELRLDIIGISGAKSQPLHSYRLSQKREIDRKLFYVSQRFKFKEDVLDYITSDVESLLFQVHYEQGSSSTKRTCFKEVALK